MKKYILIGITLLCFCSYAQENRLVRMNNLTDSLNTVRASIALKLNTSDTISLSNRINLKASLVITDSLASDIDALPTVADLNEVKYLSFILTDPDSSTYYTLIRTKSAITIDSVFTLIQGSDTSSVSFNLDYGTNRTTPSDIWAIDKTVTNITVGETLTSFTNNAIPKNNMIWLSITAIANLPSEILCVIYYH